MAGINHIAIAVRSIDERREFYEKVLGARFAGIEEVPSQKVRVGFFVSGPPGQETRLELLEPTAADSPVASFIKKRGEGLHHIAFSVDHLERRLAELKALGVRLVDEEPRPGAHGMQIAFLHPQTSGGVLVELCQERGS